MLNHGFDTDGRWPAREGRVQPGRLARRLAAQRTRPEFAKNLAILDALDTGLTCTGGTPACAAEQHGDSRQRLRQSGRSTTACPAAAARPPRTRTSTLASVLADDELYLDTSETAAELPLTHQSYLAVELSAFGSSRTLVVAVAPRRYDVIDTSYTALAIGITGFDASSQFTPAFGDGVDPHAGVTNTTFPFLGRRRTE